MAKKQVNPTRMELTKLKKKEKATTPSIIINIFLYEIFSNNFNSPFYNFLDSLYHIINFAIPFSNSILGL